jgi:sugar/nucleoside kinase (ribokinase family)
VVVAPPGIDRIFLHCPGTNDTFTKDDLDLDVVSRARLFHLGYPTLMRSLFIDDGAETARILEAVKSAGVTTSMDISLPDPNSEAGRANWRRIYERALPHTDIYLPSLEESLFTLHPEVYLKRKADAEGRELLDLVGPEECEGLADEYLAMGCRVAVIKNGHNGWFVKTASADSLAGIGRAAPQRDEPSHSQWLRSWSARQLWCPAFRVDQVASTAGAGDASIAGFLTALLQGRDIEASLRLANAAGALNLRAVDTLSGLTSWQEVAETAESLPVREIGFLQTPWTWKEELRMWEKAT